MLEIINKKYLKITGRGDEWHYPKTILTSIDAVEALEFNVTYDDHDYYMPSHTLMHVESYCYRLDCNVIFNNGKVIETNVVTRRIEYKTVENPKGRPTSGKVREYFDRIIEDYQKDFLEAKSSFQTAVRDEAFQLLLTNKLIQNNVK